MTDKEEKLLAALAQMCAQYLTDGEMLDHMCMTAGENAVDLLFEYGLVDGIGRGVAWTEKGKAFRAAH